LTDNSIGQWRPDRLARGATACAFMRGGWVDIVPMVIGT